MTKQRHYPSTAEMDYSKDEEELLKAVDRFKCETGARYPTLCELLRIVRALGYSKVGDIKDGPAE